MSPLFLAHVFFSLSSSSLFPILWLNYRPTRNHFHRLHSIDQYTHFVRAYLLKRRKYYTKASSISCFDVLCISFSFSPCISLFAFFFLLLRIHLHFIRIRRSVLIFIIVWAALVIHFECHNPFSIYPAVSLLCTVLSSLLCSALDSVVFCFSFLFFLFLLLFHVVLFCCVHFSSHFVHTHISRFTQFIRFVYP